MASHGDETTLPLIDPDDALQRAGGRAEVATELFTMLRRSLPSSAGALRAANDAADLDGLRDAAHRLRGATMYCGVPRMRAQVTEVERQCIEGDAAGLARTLPRLLNTVTAVLDLDLDLDDPLDTATADGAPPGP